DPEAGDDDVCREPVHKDRSNEEHGDAPEEDALSCRFRRRLLGSGYHVVPHGPSLKCPRIGSITAGCRKEPATGVPGCVTSAHPSLFPCSATGSARSGVSSPKVEDLWQTECHEGLLPDSEAMRTLLHEHKLPVVVAHGDHTAAVAPVEEF